MRCGRRCSAAQAEWDRALEHAAGADEVTAHLAQLSEAIRQSASGQDADLGAVPRNALSRRLLGADSRRVRSNASEASPAWTAAQLLRLLGAIERVGQRLELDWSQHFADRLSGPTGSSWWSRWPTTCALRSPPSCSSRRHSSAVGAGRSTRFRSASSASSTAPPSGSAPSPATSSSWLAAATAWSTSIRFHSPSPTSWSRCAISCSRSPRRRVLRCGSPRPRRTSGSVIRWR